MTTQIKKGGDPPAEEAPNVTGAGVGFGHQKTMQGIPTENTGGQTQEVGSKGSLPGKGMSKANAILELMKGEGPEVKAALIKMLLKDETPAAAPLVKSELLVAQPSEEVLALKKAVETLSAQVASLQKAPPLQKGMVPVGDEVDKPSLEKSDMAPTFAADRIVPVERASLKKSIEEGGSGRTIVLNRDGSMTERPLPTLEELASGKWS